MALNQIALALAVVAAPAVGVQQKPVASQNIPIRAAFVRVLDEAEVPAADMGTIQSVRVRLGQVVKAGDELARLEDSESRVAVELAELQLSIAARQAESDLPIRVAETAVREAELDRTRAQLSREIADQKLKGDVSVRQASRTRTFNKSAFDRAVAARADYAPSVSDAELEKRELEFNISDLELQKAEVDRSVAALKLQMEKASVEQYESAIERLRHAASLEKDKQQIAAITQKLRERSLELARIKLLKRSVRSPLNGEVVELLRNPGEWVEPGTPIARVIRLDRLSVEGYVPATRGVRRLVGAPVRISPPGSNIVLQGTVTYVSANVDSVNKQVEIHVEFDNKDQHVGPGEAVSAVIGSKPLR